MKITREQITQVRAAHDRSWRERYEIGEARFEHDGNIVATCDLALQALDGLPQDIENDRRLGVAVRDALGHEDPGDALGLVKDLVANNDELEARFAALQESNKNIERTFSNLVEEYRSTEADRDQWKALADTLHRDTAADFLRIAQALGTSDVTVSEIVELIEALKALAESRPGIAAATAAVASRVLRHMFVGARVPRLQDATLTAAIDDLDRYAAAIGGSDGK